MNRTQPAPSLDTKIAAVLPNHRDLFYDGKWQKPNGGYLETWNPATGGSLGPCAEADSEDVDKAVRAAHKAFREWRRTKPPERAAALKKLARLAGRKQSATLLAEQAFPWIWTGLGFAVLSGFVMFAGQATDYLQNSIFHRKLLVILLAVIFGAWILHSVTKWDQSPSLPAWTKLVALLSLALWVGAILMGVYVPAITGVG